MADMLKSMTFTSSSPSPPPPPERLGDLEALPLSPPSSRRSGDNEGRLLPLPPPRPAATGPSSRHGDRLRGDGIRRFSVGRRSFRGRTPPASPGGGGAGGGGCPPKSLVAPPPGRAARPSRAPPLKTRVGSSRLLQASVCPLSVAILTVTLRPSSFVFPSSRELQVSRADSLALKRTNAIPWKPTSADSTGPYCSKWLVNVRSVISRRTPPIQIRLPSLWRMPSL
mmetsp:Transcript_126885/g.359059  ORF Transcript_126885/g.359059 Transcript_126885/m.359059 type:complete len:225 (-) Transcript_126885:65-739(-)